MKKFLSLIILVFAITFAIPKPTQAIQLQTNQIVLVADIGQQVQGIVTYVAKVGHSVQTFIVTKVYAQDDLPAPNAGLGDVINAPKSGSGTSAWIYWLIGAFVFIYSIAVKLIPTSKSWTIAAILYQIGNLLLKDRASGGGTLAIKK